MTPEEKLLAAMARITEPLAQIAANYWALCERVHPGALAEDWGHSCRWSQLGDLAAVRHEERHRP